MLNLIYFKKRFCVQKVKKRVNEIKRLIPEIFLNGTLRFLFTLTVQIMCDLCPHLHHKSLKVLCEPQNIKDSYQRASCSRLI